MLRSPPINFATTIGGTNGCHKDIETVSCNNESDLMKVKPRLLSLWQSAKGTPYTPRGGPSHIYFQKHNQTPPCVFVPLARERVARIGPLPPLIGCSIKMTDGLKQTYSQTILYARVMSISLLITIFLCRDSSIGRARIARESPLSAGTTLAYFYPISNESTVLQVRILLAAHFYPQRSKGGLLLTAPYIQTFANWRSLLIALRIF